MGGGGKTTTTVENKEPWHGQQPYLKDAFDEAQQLFEQKKNLNDPGYTGDFYAPVRPEQTAAFENGLNFANGTGAQAVSTAMGAGTNATNMGLGGSIGALQGLFGLSGQDNTASNIAAANQYANNPMFNQMVDAGMMDARRQFSEQLMPGMERQAAANGNVNSTRQGIAQGIAERGLGEQAAALRAQLQGNAWNTGLQAAQSDAAQRQAALTSAGGLASSLFGQGMSGLQAGTDMAQKNNDLATVSSTMLQQLDQQKIDNDIAKWNYQQDKDWDQLARYWGIVGDKSWGYQGTSVSKTKEDPSLMSTLGSGAAILGSLFRCDIRVKTNINFTGEYFGDFKVYTFSYHGSNDVVRGLMAQDVEAVYPDCVHEIDGVKHIDLLSVVMKEAA